MKRFLLLMMFSLLFVLTQRIGLARGLSLFLSEQADLHSEAALPKLRLSTSTPTPIITSTPLENGEIYHVVQSHEALWNIALAYHTTIDNLKLLNSLTTDDIFAGQKLLVFKPATATATPTATLTATPGIPTLTPTQVVVPTITFTPTPLPVPPASRQSGEVAIGAIVLIALFAAGVGSWLGRKKPE